MDITQHSNSSDRVLDGTQVTAQPHAEGRQGRSFFRIAGRAAGTVLACSVGLAGLGLVVAPAATAAGTVAVANAEPAVAGVTVTATGHNGTAHTGTFHVVNRLAEPVTLQLVAVWTHSGNHPDITVPGPTVTVGGGASSEASFEAPRPTDVHGQGGYHITSPANAWNIVVKDAQGRVILTIPTTPGGALPAEVGSPAVTSDRLAEAFRPVPQPVATPTATPDATPTPVPVQVPAANPQATPQATPQTVVPETTTTPAGTDGSTPVPPKPSHPVLVPPKREVVPTPVPPEPSHPVLVPPKREVVPTPVPPKPVLAPTLRPYLVPVATPVRVPVLVPQATPVATPALVPQLVPQAVPSLVPTTVPSQVPVATPVLVPSLTRTTTVPTTGAATGANRNPVKTVPAATDGVAVPQTVVPGASRTSTTTTAQATSRNAVRAEGATVLAHTGASTAGPLALLGAVLLGLGALLVAARRRLAGARR